MSLTRKKAKTIGKVFIDVFDDESHKMKEDVIWLAQSTIYPDVIESVSATGGPSATIKSTTMSVVYLIMKLKIVEPLNTLFDEEE